MIEDKLFVIIQELKDTLGVEEVKIVENLALLSIVGAPKTLYTLGLSGRVIPLLNQLNITTSVLSQGAQELNLIVGLKEEDYEKATKGLYEGLVSVHVS